jgi:tetratricopeptide (TPR) repeat protein
LIASLRADRKNALSYTRLGYVYDGYGLFEEGLGLHSKAIALEPSLVEAYRNLGYSYHKGGKFREAIDTYDKALQFDPDNVDVHNNLGVVYDTLGNYEKGMEHFRHSLKIDPKREDTWRNLGYVYQAQGLVDDAIAAYRSAMKVNPRSPSRLQLATLYRVLHQYKEAKKELLAIVKDKPESVAAWLELAICYKELKQKKKFSETFEKAKALHANTPSEAFTRGQLMEMLDERAAVDCWTAYLAMAGEVPHEAKRYQYAQERRDALMRKLGMAPPPAHIIELEPSPPEEAK